MKQLILRILKPYFNWKEARQSIQRNRVLDAEDRARISFYRELAGDTDLIFDVGANVGNRVRAFLEIGARVVAVEPQPHCIKILKKSFGSNPKFSLCEQGLASEVGQEELHINEVNTISSFSKDWIESVKSTGRFGKLRWNQTRVIEMTTLEHLIELHGEPGFIKVDVEGFELEVIQGLRKAPRCVSFEFTPEYSENTLKCVEHLDALANGKAQFQLSLGESMRFELPNWVSRTEVAALLKQYESSTEIFGDVYYRNS